MIPIHIPILSPIFGRRDEMADDGLPTMCCCECGVGIDPVLNPSNTCVSCIRARVDITDGISTSLSVFRCRRCERFCSGTTSWVEAAQESQELLALCMKRIKGLKRVKVADAAWVWTEPHSMRLKIKLCIQKEIYNGAVIQQPLLVEFVVKNQQCPDCAAAFASMAWTASVQVRLAAARGKSDRERGKGNCPSFLFHRRATPCRSRVTCAKARAHADRRCGSASITSEPSSTWSR